MKRIGLVVFRVILQLPYWWFYKLKTYGNREKYPTIDEGYQFIHRIAKIIVKKARVNLICKGVENLPKEGGYLLAPNHQGLFDIVALFASHDRTMKFVLKKELCSTILVKDVVKVLDFYPLERKNIRDGAKMVKQVSEEINNGQCYCIFPEGTRSRNGNHLNAFKGGTFKIVAKTGCPVVPVAIIDCYKVFDNNTIKKETAQICYLKPIYYDEYKKLKTNELAELVHDRIEQYMMEQGAI